LIGFYFFIASLFQSYLLGLANKRKFNSGLSISLYQILVLSWKDSLIEGHHRLN
jgi:hypothetical protein